MREIKFRAWDKMLKRWCKPQLTMRIDGNMDGMNDYVLMQYTGLKDKEGKEIYEGDIVMYDLGIDNEKPEKYKIIFDSKQCAYFLFPLEDGARLRHFTYSAKNDCEVIGNIYEHPHLLGGE